MTILVTGTGGGLGKSLLPFLRSYYNEPVIGSGRNKTDDENYYTCDFTDELAVLELIKTVQPRLIFHLVGSFTGQFELDFQANTLSAKFIFDSLLSEKLATRVLIFGSAAEYGAVTDADNPISETFPCCPISIYGLSKAYQTDMATYYARTQNLDIVIARVFNLAMSGLSQRLFIGRANAMILAYNNGDIKQLEFGNLNSVRDYIDFENAMKQLLAIAEHGISGEIYNVGSGSPKKMRSLLQEMLEKEGIPWSSVIELNSEAIGRKGFDVPIIYADITKVLELKSSHM